MNALLLRSRIHNSYYSSSSSSNNNKNNSSNNNPNNLPTKKKKMRKRLSTILETTATDATTETNKTITGGTRRCMWITTFLVMSSAIIVVTWFSNKWIQLVLSPQRLSTLTTTEFMEGTMSMESSFHQPTSNKNNTMPSLLSSEQKQETFSEDGHHHHRHHPDIDVEIPHVVFHNLHYRRVCASVFTTTTLSSTNQPKPIEPQQQQKQQQQQQQQQQHHSTNNDNSYSSRLCMTVRYPFAVPDPSPSSSPQQHQHGNKNNTMNWLLPSLVVDPQFYNLTRLIWIDGLLLDECRDRFPQQNHNEEYGTTEDDNNYNNIVYQCLEHHHHHQARSHQQEGEEEDVNHTVLAIWTRQTTTATSSTTTTTTSSNTSSSSNTRRNTASRSNNDSKNSTFPQLYGTGSVLQQRRLFHFFRGHVILVMGDSNAPAVTVGLSQLFGTCQKQTQQQQQQQENLKSTENAKLTERLTDGSVKEVESVWVCRLPSSASHRHGRRRRLTTSNTNTSKDNDHNEDTDDSIVLTHIRYHPATRFVPMPNEFFFRRPWHVVNDTQPWLQVVQAHPVFRRQQAMRLAWKPSNNHPFNDEKQQQQQNKNQQPKLRPLALLVPYPMAHVQTQDMIRESIDQVQENQEKFPQIVLNMTTAQWAKLGFQLTRVIVWDGIPQHFPTPSGGYDTSWFLNHLDQDSGVGDTPKVPPTCRGPLPHDGILKQINEWSRRAFQQHGLDMRFYGRSWEFSNQFWWQERMMLGDESRLDCTHGVSAEAGLTMVHKYFLQAMIDSYYERRLANVQSFKN